MPEYRRSLRRSQKRTEQQGSGILMVFCRKNSTAKPSHQKVCNMKNSISLRSTFFWGLNRNCPAVNPEKGAVKSRNERNKKFWYLCFDLFYFAHIFFAGVRQFAKTECRFRSWCQKPQCKENKDRSVDGYAQRGALAKGPRRIYAPCRGIRS